MSEWRKNLVSVFGVVTLGCLLVPVMAVNAATYSPITSQLDLGSSNQNVTSLQAFLASDPAIYPEGLVTGYFGPLTRAAVIRFQNQYRIDPVGRVGPVTIAKINSLIAAGGLAGRTDISGPQFYSVAQSIATNSATFSWATNENATAKVFYNTDYVAMNEGDVNSVGFGSKNGWTAFNDGVARTGQQVTVSGLQPNTLYHYVLVSTDLSGNVSVWNPNTTFRTKF